MRRALKSTLCAATFAVLLPIGVQAHAAVVAAPVFAGNSVVFRHVAEGSPPLTLHYTLINPNLFPVLSEVGIGAFSQTGDPTDRVTGYTLDRATCATTSAVAAGGSCTFHATFTISPADVDDDFGITSFNIVARFDDFTGGVVGDSSLLTVLPVSIRVADVPEPAVWAMLLLGFGATGAALRNVRRAVAATARVT